MKIYLKYFLAFIFTASVVNAQSKLLKDLQDKFNSIKDFSADFVQLSNGKENLQGKFYFKKENKLKLELKNLIIVSDGKTNWNYNKKQKKVIISNYDENDPSVLSLKKIIFDYPSKCSVTESVESGKNVLLLKPEQNSGINAYLIKIWISKENLVEKVSMKESGGDIIEIKFANYKINTGLADSKFSFTSPEGTKTIDLR